MKYPEFVTICITILKEQDEWLANQANNRSEIIRFAINELMRKEKEKNGNERMETS